MQKKFFFIIAGAFFIAFFFVGWFVFQQKPSINDTSVSVEATIEREDDKENMTEGETKEVADAASWKVYRNEEIGIEFEYPSYWGGISSDREQACIDFSETEKEALLGQGDQCMHITLSRMDGGGRFLATESPLYTKNGIPRGGTWIHRLRFLNVYEEDFCSRNSFQSGIDELNDCRIFTTKNGLNVTSDEQEVPYSGGKEKMIAYYIRSKHPIYGVIVISATELSSGHKGLNSEVAEKEILRLIDTISFFKP